MMMNYCVAMVFLIQTIVAQNFNNIVREGDSCELSNKEKGTCIRISLCSFAREMVKQNREPENCGFINNVPITCCPKKQRKLIRLAEKKCKYIELSRFGFIAESPEDAEFTPAFKHLQIPEQNENQPFRIKNPTDFSRFPLEEKTVNKHFVPLDFSRFGFNPNEEQNVQVESNKETSDIIFPSDFSRFGANDATENISRKQNIVDASTKPNKDRSHIIFPTDFSRFGGFDENDATEEENIVHPSTKNNIKIPMDFSRFSYSPTDENKAEKHVFVEGRFSNNLIQYKLDLLPKLDTSLKAISDLIIRETPNYVLGGRNAKMREFPHMAALGYKRGNEKLWLCGGTLVTEQYVLTAAHCLISLEYGPLQYVRLGDINRDSISDHQDFQVIDKIPHPLYHSSSFYHDIGFVKLDRKVVINRFVNTACLFTEENIPPRLGLLATGWGLTKDKGDQSDILQKVELDLFSEEDCKNAYKNNRSSRMLKYGILHKQQFCAGGKFTQKDTCQGDSGGPLQIRMTREDGDIFYIVGITSFGKECGKINVPGVYTRVSFYLSWIESVLWPGET